MPELQDISSIKLGEDAEVDFLTTVTDPRFCYLLQNIFHNPETDSLLNNDDVIQDSSSSVCITSECGSTKLQKEM